MYYVYVLKGSRYYCGYTNDLKRRLQEHRRGKTQTTRILKTFDLLGYYVVSTQEEAKILEKKIKDSGHIGRWTKNVDFVVANEGLV